MFVVGSRKKTAHRDEGDEEEEDTGVSGEGERKNREIQNEMEENTEESRAGRQIKMA